MRFFKHVTLGSALVSVVLFAGLSEIRAEDDGVEVEFSPIGFALVCHPNCTATMTVEEFPTTKETEIEIEVDTVLPNEFYTVWIRLSEINPLTGAKSTALAPTTDIGALLAVTPLNAGSTDVINGFWTDDDGEGSLEVTLDFLLSDCVYPFDSYDPSLPPAKMKLAGDMAGGTLRIVSHVTDHLGHGLSPGQHEVWFDWFLTSGARFDSDDDDDDDESDDKDD